jgi:hypothetical protein
MLPILTGLLAQADTTAATVAADYTDATAATVSGFSYDSVGTAHEAVSQAAATLAGSTIVTNASDALNKVNWSTPSWDIFIVIFFVVTVFLYGISLGRDRIIVILMSIYMALAVVSAAPYINRLQDGTALKATSFIGIFLTLFFLVSRTSLNKIFGNLATGKLWQALLFSIMHVGLLVSITMSFLPSSSTAGLSPMTQKIFVSEIARFAWIVAPILAMVFFTKDDPGKS